MILTVESRDERTVQACYVVIVWNVHVLTFSSRQSTQGSCAGFLYSAAYTVEPLTR